MAVVLAAIPHFEVNVDPTARAEFPALLVACGEGSTLFAYPDEDGNVTIGKGNMIPTLEAWEAIEWVNPDDSAASKASVFASWTVLMHQGTLVRAAGREAWKGGGAYARFTTIRATPASIDRLIQSRLDEFDAALRSGWPGWDDAPPPAQSALMRIAWATGTVGPKGANRRGWPRLWGFWCAKDWEGCSQECAIPALARTEPGANERTAALFLSCVQEPTSGA